MSRLCHSLQGKAWWAWQESNLQNTVPKTAAYAVPPHAQNCIYGMPSRYVKAKKIAKNPTRFRVRNKHILESDGCVGQCWPGSDDGQLIEIDPRQCPKDYMDTIIHEALHHLFPKKKEPSILRSGTSLANLLWRLGYRRVKNGATGRT